MSCQEQTGNDGTGYTVGTGVATAQNYKWANNSVRKVQWDKKSEVEPYFADQGQKLAQLPLSFDQFRLTVSVFNTRLKIYGWVKEKKLI